MLARKWAGVGLPLAVYLVVLLGSIGTILVLFRYAPSLEAFVYALTSEVGVYLVVCTALAAIGAAVALRAYGTGRSPRWLLLGFAVAMALADGVLAMLLAPPRSSIVGLLRHLPMLTPGHVLLLLVVVWYCWWGSTTRPKLRS
jgi:hypothetical protein